MKKKLISLCAAFAMTTMSVIPAQAAGPFEELKVAIREYAQSVGGTYINELNIGLNVSTNMERAHANGTYTDELGAVVAYVPANKPTAKFDYKTTMDMTAVVGAMKTYWLGALLAIDNRELSVPGSRERLLTALDEVPVTGGFTVDVIYPDSVTIPESVISGGNMEGFTQIVPDGEGYKEQAISPIFTEVRREVLTATPTAEENTLRITIQVTAADGTGVLEGGDLNANLDTYLGDIVLTCEDLEVTGIGTHTIKGTVNGYTNIGGTITNYSYSDFNTNSVEDYIALVEYEAVQGSNEHDVEGEVIEEEVILATPTPRPSGGGDDSSGHLPNAGGGPVATPTPTPAPGEGQLIPSRPETDVELNKDDHYAYIIGYPEGDVRPEGNITRAEVATIFFRIMGDASRDKYATSENSYSDVQLGDWFNNAISTATAAGIVKGYEDGTFRPNNAITRAEFATIAARFISARYEGSNMFGDIDGHWAVEYINRACKYGWINGYGDGTFVPDRNITRAEAMTLVNTVLGRKTDPDKMHDDMVDWVDNVYGMWYYAAVQEATNPHTYTRDANGVETWTAVMENRDWKALEIAVFGE